MLQTIWFVWHVVSVYAVTVERKAKKQINLSVRRSEKCLQPVELKCVCFFFPQPGKLTEAFKYFVQGMGYSEYLLFRKVLKRNLIHHTVYFPPFSSPRPPYTHLQIPVQSLLINKFPIAPPSELERFLMEVLKESPVINYWWRLNFELFQGEHKGLCLHWVCFNVSEHSLTNTHPGLTLIDSVFWSNTCSCWSLSVPRLNVNMMLLLYVCSPVCREFFCLIMVTYY